MGSATLTPGVRYMMPPNFGPSHAPDVESDFDCHGASVDFDTSAEAVDALLPRWFRPAARPSVTISYRRMLNMAWMGGRDYQLATISMMADYDRGGTIETNPYVIAIWESDTAPILAGRELMGAPKLFGTIPPVEIGAADHSFTAHEYDALLLRGSLSKLTEIPADKVARAAERAKDAWGWYWKHIPGPGGVPDADYPVGMKMWTPFTRMWRGAGSFEWGTPDAQAAPYSHAIIAAMRALPILSDVRATAWHAEKCTLFRNQTKRWDI